MGMLSNANQKTNMYKYFNVEPDEEVPLLEYILEIRP